MKIFSRISLAGALAASLVVATTASWPDSAFAQRRRGGPPPPHAVRRGDVVFIGGYFYDPFFGPYPWWPRAAYPYPYYPVFDRRAVVRVIATPKDAAVHVDGFYAGTVHDFNDFWQGLPLPPGGHEIVLHLDGYRTVRQRVYLAPATTFKLRAAMEPLPAGEASEPVTAAPPVPPPPVDSFAPPRTPSTATPSDPGGKVPPGAALGTLTLRVQPAGADIDVDGERWASSDTNRVVIQLAAGVHRLEASKAGYRRFAGEVQVREGETTTINVTLSPQRP